MNEKLQAIKGYKALIERYGKPITKEEYKELKEYSDEHHVRISGFKEYVGNIENIKAAIDVIAIIATDFPRILDDRNGVVLQLDYGMGEEDIAEVNEHIMSLNAIYFCNFSFLKESYAEGTAENRYVCGTDWLSVIRHETGHVVGNMYHINSMNIAKGILKTKSSVHVLMAVRDLLSKYSAEDENGGEIISECFSAYYGGIKNDFAKRFVNECIELVKGGRVL